MRVIFGMVLLAGVALAGGAVYMAKGYIGQYQAELARAQQMHSAIVPTQQVFVATRHLRYGDTLKPEDVRAVNWPVNAIPQGVFTDIAALFPEGTDEPRLIIRPMEPSEAVLAVKITEPGEDIGLTTRLEKGMRAFAIRVDVASGVSGFLRPGDKVDVYWTGGVQTGNGREDVTKLIQTAVRLIAVDQIDDQMNGARIARTVTVAATPEQVAALAQAQSTGNLSLSLVGVGDDEELDEIKVNQVSLLGLQQAAPVIAAPAARVCSIRTRRGSEVVAIPIPCTN
ncbi:Flp pilus assembly protein CpaB [Roseobacter denitrificans]|uniref:Pilus assembly domain protein n=1 Tax=Roseobacter denitrificans (strain ATCC 33942 / OCh 114) TaxID=375451 RepID=Q167X4_ROSDO|nr:Flp pilus assembly protein CpaB [Roseobacter denitrificans]ABG31719.1 pilus assembly domain protein [Roseobacter denitrificans OCh 114]AVL54657.1 Flp pilus assembly protein CpaB [Roseobacter denitrificans]SFF87867.1 pilus assembly protein CpaB [Roseobacter denitrificans OCh 114]